MPPLVDLLRWTYTVLIRCDRQCLSLVIKHLTRACWHSVDVIAGPSSARGQGARYSFRQSRPLEHGKAIAEILQPRKRQDIV